MTPAIGPNNISITTGPLGGTGTTVIDAIQTWAVADGEWSSLPDLDDLAGTSEAWASTPGRWGSIRTANIDGAGGDEVLALDGQGLQAWSYDTAAGAWSKLQPPTPLALGADPWLTNPEYYSTIQTGDVDGDGRDDVVARGPTGMRTWFYDRRGSTAPPGWQRYRPSGYPDFPATCPAGQTGTCGQAAAYAAFSRRGHGKDIRATWASVTQLPQNRRTSPGRRRICTTPRSCQESAGERRADELRDLHQPGHLVRVHDGRLDRRGQPAVRGGVLGRAGGGALPGPRHDPQERAAAQPTDLAAIYQELNLQAATQNASPDAVRRRALWSLITGIAGSVAGLVQPEVGAGLATASYIFSALPSSQDSTMDTFTSSYSQLSTQFATMVGDMLLAEEEQIQTVYQDQGLLTLLGQLR